MNKDENKVATNVQVAQDLLKALHNEQLRLVETNKLIETYRLTLKENDYVNNCNDEMHDIMYNIDDANVLNSIVAQSNIRAIQRLIVKYHKA